MSGKIKIIGIGGSLEKNSATLNNMNFLLEKCRILGAEIKLLDIRKLPWPIFNYSKKPSPKILKILDEIYLADGLIFASPEYHGTVSASFKNIIDYFEFLSVKTPPYLTRKPVACLAVAGADNAGGLTLNTMINIVHNLRGITAANSFAVSTASEKTGKNIINPNERIKRRINRLAEEIVDLSVKLKN